MIALRTTLNAPEARHRKPPTAARQHVAALDERPAACWKTEASARTLPGDDGHEQPSVQS